MENKKKKVNGVRIGAIIVSVLVAIGFIGLLTGIILLMNILESKPQFEIAKFDNKQSSKIYDKDNKLIATVGGTIRENVDYEKYPNVLIDGFIATEDSRFFTHNGFDLSRFTKSFIDNLIGILTKSGGGLKGGSTFTMQLVKNSYFTDDSAGVIAATSGMDGIKRKFQEIALAMELEEKTDKKNILQLYINKMNFGANGRGIENAAKYYFNKNAKDLNTSEVAILIGTVNSPYYYNPFNYLDKATERRDTVLALMLKHGYIDDKEYKLAKSIKVEDLLVDPYKKDKENNGGNDFQAYIDAVIAEVEELTGISAYGTGMNIYTHMDPIVQKQIDRIQREDSNGYVYYPDELIENASIVIENHTGAIIGIMGGRNYAKGGTLLLNHAIDQYKQPGSSIKTILDYPLAFEKLGWSTSHVVLDKPTYYRGTDVLIGNVTGTYVGELKLKRAVAESLNTVAINTLQEVMDKTSNEEVVSYLNKMGYNQVDIDNFNVQYAIGGSTLAVSTLQQAGAQAAIVNGGTYHKPHTIKKIEFLDGRAPIEPVYEGVRTLSSAAAFQTTELLKYNIAHGNSWAYDTLIYYPVTLYAKSGTSDWGSDGYGYDIPYGESKDVWIVCSTADHTIATWTGYEKAIKGKDTYMSDYKKSLNISGKATELILDSVIESNGNPKNSVTPPDDITSITHISGTFPYAYPISGMDNKFIDTGYIAKKFAKLVEPEKLTVEKINSFDVKIDSDGNIDLNWGEYPNKDKLKISDGRLSLGNGWVGKKYFDYSWVFGAIKYKAKVILNDEVIKTYKISDNKLSDNINILPGSKIKVCGYYGYDNSEINSAEICKDFVVEDPDVNITYPIVNETSYSRIIKEYNSWARSNKVDFYVTRKYTSDPNQASNNLYLNGDIKAQGSSEKYKKSQISSLNFELVITTYVKCNNGHVDPETGICIKD